MRSEVEISDEVVVIAEHAEGEVKPVTFEVVQCAQQIARVGSLKVRILIAADDPYPMAVKIGEKTGVDVTGFAVSGLSNYNSALYKQVFSAQAAEIKPRYVCVAHTSQGLDFAPGLAVRLGSSCITGVNSIEKSGNDLLFSRFICNGKINTQIKGCSETTLIAVQPGFFPFEPCTELPGRVEVVTMCIESDEIKSKGLIKAASEISALSSAKIVVAAGRGIGQEENLAAVERFAEHFSGSAVGGSRPLIDMGWMEYKNQVGITGATVSPDIYIACGISGSSQHVAGMRSSGFVISINSDSSAAIFNISDVCVVEDVVSFIEVFEKVLGEKGNV